MDESHHCNVLQLLLKSEGWMNFRNDTSHVPGCQVTILNSGCISQQTSSHWALVCVSADRSARRKRTGWLHKLDCSKLKLSPFFFSWYSSLASNGNSFQDGQWRHGTPTDTFYSIGYFFFYCLSRSTPWSVRQGAGRS